MKYFRRTLLVLLLFAVFFITPIKSQAAAFKPLKKTITLEYKEKYTITYKNVPQGAKIKYSYSTTDKYVSVSKKGVIKAKNYPGKTTYVKIKAKVTKKGSKTKIYNFKIKVKIKKGTKSSKSAKISSIRLNQYTLSLTEGETASLIATVSPSNASTKSLTWNSNDTSVATVTSSGIVTAISEGNATITVSSQNGRSAECAVTVVPYVPTFGLNEEWYVPGQWKFKITGITRHYACNQFSDKTGEEVILISYHVENIGYTGTIQNLLLTIDRVYDSQNYKAETYPCTHETYGGVLDPGTQADYSEAYILKHSGSSIKIVLEQYQSNSYNKKTAYFIIPY